jgi:hypothetical protein
MQIAPARRLEVLTQLVPSGFQTLDVGIPLDRLAVRAQQAQLVAFVPKARPDFARQVLSSPLEEPDHAATSDEVTEVHAGVQMSRRGKPLTACNLTKNVKHADVAGGCTSAVLYIHL